MSHLAFDFGTSNSVVTVYREETGQVETLRLADLSRRCDYVADGKRETVYSIPSLICYQPDRDYLGNQVLERGLADQSFRWMKRFIGARRRYLRKVNGKSYDDFIAAEEFIGNIIGFCLPYFDPDRDELIMTLPVESFEDYREWLSGVLDRLDIKRYRFLDEPTACALGHHVKARSDDALLVFDFGGGTLDVSVVKVDLGASGDRKAKVIGKAGCELGGMDIDQWLAKDLLERNGIPERQVKELLARVLLEVEGVKERLSFATDGKTEEPVSLVDPSRGLVLTGGYSRRDLEDLLEANGLPQQVNNTITDALTAAAEKYGVRSADIKTVLMTGGTSLIPYVQKLVRNFFGARVRCERPFDAVATGACYYASGAEDLIDHIQHNYALKYFDAKRNVHDYKTLIPAGVPYPTEEEFIAFHLKGLYDGMEDFGLFICEVGKSGSGKCTLRTTAGGEFEYQADDSGTNGVFCINEDKPTFIKANPPSKKDEKRFKVSFNVDSQRRLRVTVFDLLTRHFICRDMPVVKLV